VVMMAFTYWFIPETKGIPIEDMDLVWTRHWFWKRFVWVSTILQPMSEVMANNFEMGSNNN